MNANVVILYVADLARSRLFYRTTLGVEPVLDVPGMTEFDLGSVSLGLMPLDDMIALVPGITAGRGQRCEPYLRREDAEQYLRRASVAGARILSPLQTRPWGETVAYCLDPDGHVLAFATT